MRADVPLIRVACGVLVGAGNSVLIAQRPAGKLAAGKWEFPGGKIEAGESALQALVRELDEELGIQVRMARRLLRFTHDYSDRRVGLDVLKVIAFDGEPQPRESQAFRWLDPQGIAALDVLPTVLPILRALALPRHYVFTPPRFDMEALFAAMAGLPAEALVRLRCPALDDARYETVAKTFVERCRALALLPVLDRAPDLSLELGASWHATETAWRREVRPVASRLSVLASVHDAGGCSRATQWGADALVLGPVQATATHPGATALGWAGLAACAAQAERPVFAIGGLPAAALPDVIAAGGHGIAGISAYWPGLDRR